MVNPSDASLADLASSNGSRPIAMLNLLHFDGEAGRTAYGRYAEVAAQSIAAVGGGLIYLGRVIDSDTWDSVALVYYPAPRPSSRCKVIPVMSGRYRIAPLGFELACSIPSSSRRCRSPMRHG